MKDGHDRYDVVVVGGGPAGSGSAGLLALDGHRVLLLEREKFPRYHIGESLITGVWPTLDRLGLRDRMESLGFQRKYGGSLRWGAGGMKPWSFEFREASGGRYEHAYQVRRADFDALLHDRARELGVCVLEGAAVREPVVDASGQQRWLGRHLDMVGWHEDLRNVAAWSYFEDGLRYEGEAEGNILTENRPHGWLWYIPLSRRITSIGYVTPTSRLVESGLTPERLLDQQIAESSEVARLTASPGRSTCTAPRATGRTPANGSRARATRWSATRSRSSTRCCPPA